MAIPSSYAALARQIAAANAANNAKNIRATGATTGEAARFARQAPVGTTTKAPTPKPSASKSLAQTLRNTGATTGEAQRFANIATGNVPRQAPLANPVTTTPTPISYGFEPMLPDGGATGSDGQGSTVESTTPVEAPVTAPVEAPVEAPVAAYNVYDDPFYQQALAAAQSQFNLERINALAGTQYEERGIRRQLEQRIPEAEAERRRLAGNFARRGMAGGRYGALTRAEAEVNAREIGLRTGLREQIAELNRQFVSQFGAPGTDWLGTLRGSQAQQAAIQQALQNRLGGLTTVG